MNRLFILFTLFVFNFSLSAQVRLPKIISDGMILQRDAKINVWGWASPNEKVSVQFDKKKYDARADAEGKTQDRELWPLIAPYITDWNISGVDADGNAVDIPAPADGGPEQFQYIPPQLFSAVYRDLMFRGTPPLARKTPSASASTPEPSPEPR